MGWKSKHARLAYSRSYYARNKDRVNAYHREWYAANREKLRTQRRARYVQNREEHLKRNRAAYRRAVARGKRPGREYPEPTRKMPKRCECCGRASRRALALDHCHRSSKFRGWLCVPCNAGIGMLGDTPAGVLRALRYLKRAAK
jgi:hypothetical protein